MTKNVLRCRTAARKSRRNSFKLA